MSAPRWAVALLGWLAPHGRAEDVLGDLEEAHRVRIGRHRRAIANILTGLEALDMAVALLRERIRRGRAADRRTASEGAPTGGSRSEYASRPERGPQPGGGWPAGRGLRPEGGLIRTRVSLLDVKLGIRMLVKHPGLTLVGGLGMAVAIAIGAGSFGMIYTMMDAELPLDEGDRVVSIQNWDAARGGPDRHALHDFAMWREELESVEDVGAFRRFRSNLITADGGVGPVRVAEMTASGFRVARVPPLLGRTLIDADETAGAPPVVVVGYDVWRTRFAFDPDVVGREVRLGNAVHTVVGVMPEGFAFPVNQNVWTPLRLDPSDHERGGGPVIYVFGRLASGVGLDEARAELTTLARRAAVEFPETHEHLRPQVLPYAYPFGEVDSPAIAWGLHLIQLLVSMLLVVVAVNVAILVYARTATRLGEIAVRSALGASRRRIVGQLLIEGLVLSAAAAAVGLVIAGIALRRVNAFFESDGGRQLPFWIDFGLSSGTVVYAVGLAVLGAVIVGVVPALKATGRRVRTGLQRLGSGGSGMQMGRTWTALIVAQVAIAVAVLPPAMFHAGESIRYGTADPGFAADEFLTAWLYLDEVAEAGVYDDASRPRYAAFQAELVQRLEAEPGVSDAVITMGVPGEEARAGVEVEGLPTPAGPDSAVGSGTVSHTVGVGRVVVDFFDVFDIPFLAGRGFRAGDVDTAAAAVIVNRSFVDQILGGGRAPGRRVRVVGGGEAERGPWHEVVGVVDDFPPNPVDGSVARARLYRPMIPGEVYPVSVTLRVRGAAPASFAGRLREVTAALDPTLRLGGIQPLDEVLREEQWLMRLIALGIALVTLSVLLLSAAGLSALMAFTVARRRREIGIRSALGADPRRLLGSIFSRAAGRLTIGVIVGVAASGLLDWASGGELMGGERAVLLPAVAALMMVVGLLAAVGPARRGLRIQPTEALREE